MSWRRPIRTALLFTLALLSNIADADRNIAIDNILLSKTNGISTVQIWPSCRMRYMEHSPNEAGLEVRIRVGLGPDCEELFADAISERYAPPELGLGNVNEVVFDWRNPRDVFITLHFKKPQKFEVRQHSVGWIEVYVDTNIDSTSLPAIAAVPLPDANTGSNSTRSSLPSPTRSATSSAGAAQTSRPTTRSNIEPSSDGNYVVQLGVFDQHQRALRLLQSTATPHFAYRTELTVNDRTWHGLQLGFFATESAAEQVAGDLRDTFPDAWVRYVDPDEAARARAGLDLRKANNATVYAIQARAGADLDEAELASLVADGRDALLERRYQDAIRVYTRVLEAPGHAYRAEAREMLGIAFERNQQAENAIAEYQGFLDEFGESMGAARVADRMLALETAAAVPGAPSTTVVRVAAADAGGWQIRGGLSQYYWRNQEQLVHDGNYRVSSSGALTLGDVLVNRRGERFDVQARLNGAYQLNLVDYDETGDIGWINDAYVDVLDKQLRLEGRLGRQNRRSDGIVSRFDGVGLRYQWQPDISFSVSTGIPVDSPRYIGDADRFFYAASASIDNLLDGRFTASAFTHQQTVDGISDRQAVGGEFLFREDSWSVFSMLDYDASYGVLNTGLVNAIWQLDNGWSLSGRLNVGAQPFLTTRNALMGQTVTSIEALLETYSEAQVRGLARDRTSQATATSIGLSAPIGARLDLSVDLTMRNVEASAASGSVPARPATNNEFFFNTTLAAAGLVKENDLLLLTFRYDDLSTRNSARVIFDLRLPLGNRLRLSPRISVTQNDLTETDSSQTVVIPSVRVLYRWGSMLLDLEAGGRWSNRELPLTEIDPFTADGTEELLGGFVNLGYRWEF